MIVVIEHKQNALEIRISTSLINAVSLYRYLDQCTTSDGMDPTLIRGFEEIETLRNYIGIAIGDLT